MPNIFEHFEYLQDINKTTRHISTLVAHRYIQQNQTGWQQDKIKTLETTTTTSENYYYFFWEIVVEQ